MKRLIPRGDDTHRPFVSLDDRIGVPRADLVRRVIARPVVDDYQFDRDSLGENRIDGLETKVAPVARCNDNGYGACPIRRVVPIDFGLSCPRCYACPFPENPLRTNAALR